MRGAYNTVGRQAKIKARGAQGSPAAGAAAAPAVPATNKQNGTIDAARARMYEATFAGVGAPEWNNAVCVANREVLPGVRVVTLEVRRCGAARARAALRLRRGA